MPSAYVWPLEDSFHPLKLRSACFQQMLQKSISTLLPAAHLVTMLQIRKIILIPVLFVFMHGHGA